MTNLADTILSKSDQLNAIDLIATEKTITVTKVDVVKGREQPTWIYYDGDNGRPFKPSLGMRRVLCAAWTDESDDYIGRSMTLFNEPTVMWGGKQVGGLQISHVSHIEKPVTIPLIITRGKSIAYTVKPLILDGASTASPTTTAHDPSATIDAITKATAAASNGKDEFLIWFNSDEGKQLRPLFKDDKAEMGKLSAICKQADAAIDDDPFGLPPIEGDGVVE